MHPGPPPGRGGPFGKGGRQGGQRSTPPLCSPCLGRAPSPVSPNSPKRSHLHTWGRAGGGTSRTRSWGRGGGGGRGRTSRRGLFSIKLFHHRLSRHSTMPSAFLDPKRGTPVPPRRSRSDEGGEDGDDEEKGGGTHRGERAEKGVNGVAVGPCLSTPRRKSASHARRGWGGEGGEGAGRGCCVGAPARPHLADWHGGCGPPARLEEALPAPAPCARGIHTLHLTHRGQGAAKRGGGGKRKKSVSK